MARLSLTLLVALTFAVAASAAAAASPAAASLKVTVSPTMVHPGAQYTVTISGRYTRASKHRTPYLLAFIQYRAGRCKLTATAEYQSSDWVWDFFPPSSVPKSPFVRIVHWTAKSRLGTRHVCAYLYAHKISPVSRATPLTRASASFVDARR